MAALRSKIAHRWSCMLPGSLRAEVLPVIRPRVSRIERTTLFLYAFLYYLKPQRKVVTAQAFQICLYYVHVNSEGDEELMKTAR